MQNPSKITEVIKQKKKKKEITELKTVITKMEKILNGWAKQKNGCGRG